MPFFTLPRMNKNMSKNKKTREWSQNEEKEILWWWCIKGCHSELKSRQERKIQHAEGQKEETQVGIGDGMGKKQQIVLAFKGKGN